MKLTDWIIIDGYCATRALEGADYNKVENRVAFIEKTPRVRVAPFTNEDEDFKNWKYGCKGSDWGMDEDSRKWCDDELLKLGYDIGIESLCCDSKINATLTRLK